MEVTEQNRVEGFQRKRRRKSFPDKDTELGAKAHTDSANSNMKT